jgi:putative ABC transport system permease protein
VTLATVLGALLYRLLIALALNADFIGLQAQDLNLITAVLVGLALVLPKIKGKLRNKQGGKSA